MLTTVLLCTFLVLAIFGWFAFWTAQDQVKELVDQRNRLLNLYVKEGATWMEQADRVSIALNYLAGGGDDD